MFTIFRYGLMPVVAFCAVIIAASVNSYTTQTVRKATWIQTDVTVVQSQDFGDIAAKWGGTQNTYPDPHGEVQYMVNGHAYVWQGRGREIGLINMNPGEKIKLYYNPKNPREISSLVLLGASTGNAIFAAACVFVTFYFWFFWFRGFFGRSGPGGFGKRGGGPPGGRATDRPQSQLERLLASSDDQLHGAHVGDMNGGSARGTTTDPRGESLVSSGLIARWPTPTESMSTSASFNQTPRTTFGKR